MKILRALLAVAAVGLARCSTGIDSETFEKGTAFRLEDKARLDRAMKLVSEAMNDVDLEAIATSCKGPHASRYRLVRAGAAGGRTASCAIRGAHFNHDVLHDRGTLDEGIDARLEFAAFGVPTADGEGFCLHLRATASTRRSAGNVGDLMEAAWNRLFEAVERSLERDKIRVRLYKE